VDVKFIEPLGQTGKKKRYYQYTAIDDCTRVRVLRAYPKHDQKTAIMFIDHVLSNRSRSRRSRPTTAPSLGSPSTGTCSTRASDTSTSNRPPPGSTAKWRDPTDSEEFYRLLEGQVIDDVNLFNEKLQEWEEYYNYDRPHGALAGATPYERLKQKTQDPLS
jgi:transposase InsO family protein